MKTKPSSLARERRSLVRRCNHRPSQKPVTPTPAVAGFSVPPHSVHVTWSRKTGSWLGVGNDSVYVKTRCFETFPFPALEEGQLKQRIRALGERLDSHRKRQQEQHPGLTLTGMYHVLEKLRSGEPLTARTSRSTIKVSSRCSSRFTRSSMRQCWKRMGGGI